MWVGLCEISAGDVKAGSICWNPMAFDARISHVFANPAVGTPPFVSGFWLRNSAGTYDPTIFQGLVDAMAANWADSLNPVIWSGLHGGTLVADVSSDTETAQFVSAIDSSDTSGQSTAIGIAIRAIFQAPRPPKGRANGMYIPLPTASAANVEGVISGTALDAVTTWGDATLALLDLHDWVWVAHHQIGGPSAPVTRTSVTGASAAGTASYLRRRYR